MRNMKFVLLVIIALLMTASALGQPKQISEAEYYASYREALDKQSNSPRREVLVQERYEDGKLISSNQYTYEYESKTKSSFIGIETTNGNVIKTEEIQLGKMYYCRKDNKKWIVSEISCSPGRDRSIPYPNDSKVAVEKTADGDAFTQYTTYKDYAEPSAKRFYSENILIGKDGNLLKLEVKMGLANPERVVLKESTTYEYGRKINIKAPIK
jgi:hypothetical protein